MEFAHIEACCACAAAATPAAAADGAARGRARRGSRRPTGCSNAPPQNSNEELSLAYRRQLSRHHPDKLKANGLPESMLEHAKERTQQIIEAWELVRERRGI